jgi:hypothetical protein
MAIRPSGIVGIGTTNPSGAQLQIAGTGANGFTLGVEGNVTQNLNNGGFVKAMITVDPFQLPQNYIQKCWNGTNGASSGNCGFTVARNSPGDYLVTFGFDVSDRFVSLTMLSSSIGFPVAIASLGFTTVTVIINKDYSLASGDRVDNAFTLVIF